MLREMGVRLWAPDDAGVPVVAEPEARVAATVGAEARLESNARPSAPPRDAAETPREPSRAVAATAREAQRMPGLASADWLVVADPLDPADPQQQQLLDNMLRAIGIGLLAPNRERRAVLFAIEGAGAIDMPGAADRLRAALDVVAPRCVLAFGRAAAAALLGADVPVGDLRGRVHAHAGVPVVVTFTLAFLLRHPAEKAKAWADLCLAVRALEAPTS